MVNQIANLVVSAAQRSDANPASANAAPDAQSTDTFGSVLAKQIGQKSSNSATPSNSTATSSTTVATTSTTINNATRLKDKSKLTQDIAPAPDAAAMTLAMLGSIKPSTGSKTVDSAKGRDQQAIPAAPDAAALTLAMLGSIKASTGSKTVDTAKSQDQQAIPAAPDTAANSLLLVGNPQIQLVNNVAAKSRDQQAIPAAPDAAANPLLLAANPQIQLVNNVAAKAATDAGGTNAIRASASAHQATATQLSAASDKNAPAADPALIHASKTDALIHSDIKNTPESAKAADLTISLPATQAIAQPASQPYTSSANAIAAPLGSNAWPAEFAQKITWMGSQQNQVAELHLNPPDLGPMSVVLSITDNQATAQFSSPHSAVREAIENAMPKLRESLADNGIMLGNATVSDQPARDNGAENFMRQRNNPRAEAISATEATPLNIPPTTTRRHNGMVDTFA